MPLLPITQHKRFVPYGTHLNSTFGGTSFMPITISGSADACPMSLRHTAAAPRPLCAFFSDLKK